MVAVVNFVGAVRSRAHKDMDIKLLAAQFNPRSRVSVRPRSQGWSRVVLGQR